MRGGHCLPGPASLAAVGICVDRCIQAPGQPCPGALGRPLTDNEFFGGGGAEPTPRHAGQSGIGPGRAGEFGGQGGAAEGVSVSI